jgi:hypothetical protein
LLIEVADDYSDGIARPEAPPPHANAGQAIPKIVHQFQSLPDVGWYGSAYLLTTTSLQPSFGKIYTYFNVKYTFIAALTIFESSHPQPASKQS